MEIYFDNAATTMVCKEAADVAYKVMTESYGNPSSLHNKGLEVEKQLRIAREQVAHAWGVTPGEVYFTSGGTESNNISLGGAILKGRKWGNKVITTKAEHPAVLEVLEHYREALGIEVVYIDLLENGLPDMQQLKEKADDKVILVSMMHVNNETGVIMPVREAVSIVKKAAPRSFAHSDMVQSFGKTGVTVAALGVDFASISGHKIHGPKGIGALYIKKGITIPTMVFGGGQEKNVRSGTENTPGICGFGEAAALAEKEHNNAEKITAEVKDIILKGVMENLPDCKVNGENTVSNVLSISFCGLKSEILLHSLESKGIYVSSGSACSSNHPSPSKVLTAMGRSNKEIDGSLRFSFSRYNTPQEAKRCVEVLLAEVPEIRRFYGRR